ncbi:MAG: DNA cytosine methyltransferase [Sedimenticola sp.]
MNKPDSKHELIAVDLFSGAGGFSLSARNVGIGVLAAVEFDKHASNTYRKNLIEKTNALTKLFEDIRAFEPEEMMAEVGLHPGDCDVLLGGPPCQGFSTHRINDAGVDDVRNQLLIRYFEFVASLRPKVFLVENVPGLLWKRHEKYLKEFYKLARSIGYRVSEPEALNARDFGVPQNRKRIFILGVDKKHNLNIDWPPEPTHIDPKKRVNGKSHLPVWKNSAEVFENPLPVSDPNNIHMNHSQVIIDAFKKTPPNGGSRFESGRVLECHKNHNGHKDVYGRINPKVPGPTMTTACINPSKGRFVHPTEHHGITVRHAARFQTFPDGFVFEGGLMAAGVQVGNAVPIILGESVLNPIQKALINKQ